MKKKIIAVNLCMLLLVVIVGVAAASTVDKYYNKSTTYTYFENGSVTKFESRSRMQNNSEVSESFIQNTTTSMNVNVTVAVKSYNAYAGAYMESKSNSGTIAAGAGLGCAPVSRPTATNSNFYVIHSGTAVGNGSGSPRDSYTVRVYR